MRANRLPGALPGRVVQTKWVALMVIFAASSLLAIAGAAHSKAARSARSPSDSAAENPAMQQNQRPRAREAGIEIGVFAPGKHNAITDVPGVKVGHKTLREGDSQRTGVTAILPHDGNIFQQKVPAAVMIGNGFGKLVGISQVQELGLIETPILLTNTVSAFAVADALVAYTLQLPGNEAVQSVNPIVGECNDGFLNDIRAMSVTREHVLSALKAAVGGPVDEGCVGAGTGTQCLGFKGGIGTSSRVMPESVGGYTVGVLVQSNFGGILSVNGAPVGKELGVHAFRQVVRERQTSTRQQSADNDEPDAGPTQEHGSCMVVVATNAPLDARQLERLARRALLGLAAVGSPLTHGSGDYVISFSTAASLRVPYSPQGKTTQGGEVVRDDRLSPLFQGVKEATEEAVLNSLFRAETTTGRDGHTTEALPLEPTLEICRQHGVLMPGK